MTPTTGLPTAAQPAVPAPSPAAAPAPTPPQRVRYATEPGGYPAPAGQGYGPTSAGYGAAPAAGAGYGAGAGYVAAQPAYHPPAGHAASAASPAPAPGQSASPPPGGRTTRRDGGRAPRSSGRLSAGWIAFIVVDVLLVIGAVVFAVSLLGGGDDPAGDGAGGAAAAPSSAATPSEPEPEDAEAVPTVTESFASKTRNITCEMTDVGVTCSIAELGSQPAPVAGCDGTVGYRVVLDADGVTQPCVPSGEQPQAAPGGVEVLPYGKSKTVGGFTCDSADTGVTCRDDATGKGFTVARAGIRTL
ncbi:hypothetical protein [Cellulosimicrobium marinum]|uniref:hypothetical protein n=1 Tax=Cellulosimicrobium marinum TaxID=1638992 RepID=UPI001E2EEE7B|nr:hypothetical protein [Cellulosimicrobium marinum]MCB7136357.1 hypothetical protein [Cellulosimicrobium marinum]